VQGTQGSGKSTLAAFLKLLLESEHALSTVSLSLDDFYLTLAERRQLATDKHPLLITRGVPGTHDVKLAMDTIQGVSRLEPGETFAIPRFDKSMDDRAARENWDEVSGPVSVIIFEGWCVGCDALPSETMNTPINSLEEQEDPEGVWREYANQQLAGDYHDLFALLEKLIVINAPSFECVHEWRVLQEQKLEQKLKAQGLNATDKMMNAQQLHRFISHYERITRHCLDTLPKKADWLLPLDAEHKILDLIAK